MKTHEYNTLTHTHIHTHTGGEDSNVEQKTWQAYGFGNRNALKLDILYFVTKYNNNNKGIIVFGAANILFQTTWTLNSHRHQ